MQDYNKSYLEVLKRIRSTRKKEANLEFFTAAMKFLSIAAIALLLVSSLELLFNGSEVFRTTLAAIFVLIIASSVGALLAAPLAKITGYKGLQSEEQIALRIGEKHSELKDKLCNALQLIASLGSQVGTSSALSIAAFTEIATLSKDKNFDDIIDKRVFKKTLLFFLVSIIFVSSIFLVFQTSIGNAFNRVVNYNQSYLPPAPFSLELVPRDSSILRGQTVSIIVKAKGTAPEFVSLFLKEERQENYDSYKLKPDSNNYYVYTIPVLKNSIEFYAEADWLNSKVAANHGKIKVVDKPELRAISGRIIYPHYTRLAPASFTEQNADFSALRGSNIQISLLSNKELSKAEIIIEKLTTKQITSDSVFTQKDSLVLPMAVDGRKASGSFSLSSTLNYYFILRDKEGEQSVNPVKYTALALSDDYPSISLIDPTSDVFLSEKAILPLKVGISDDYGFSQLLLYYRLADSKYAPAEEKFNSIRIPIHSNDLSLEVNYLWDLNLLGISPEDKFEFYFEVFDNDIVTGPKSAKTRVLTARLPSLEEVLKEVDKGHENIEKELENTLKKAEEIKKDMEELNREMLKNPMKKDLDWKEKKKLEDILKKQEDLKDKLADVQQNIQDITNKLDENKALSPETLQKYMELQSLLKDVNSAELQKLQERMQEAMQNLTPDQIQKAMKETKFDEEQFRKGLERTIKILKRLQAEQKVDALQKRAEELAKKQEDLQKKTDNANPNDQNKKDELAKEQSHLQDDLKDLSKELKDLEDLMKEIGDNMPMKDLEKAKQELNQEQTKSEMQNAEQDLKKGDFEKSKKSQKKAQQNLQNFAQSLMSLKKSMEDELSKEAQRKLQQAMVNLLELSARQEDLLETTKASTANSVQIPKLTEAQSEILDAIANVTNMLAELSQKTFAVTAEMGKHLGDAIQRMQTSTQNMADRSTHRAAQEQAQAMASMNAAAMEIQSMLSSMQQGGGSCPNADGKPGGGSGGSNFMESLQQLSQQQQGINEAMQQLGQGGSLSLEQQAQLGRLAQAQGQAQKTAEELAAEQKQIREGSKKGTGDLEKIAQEMKEVVKDMESGNISPATLKRQEQILSRLLDATRSIHDRDYEKKRESKTGDNITRQSPGSFDLSTQEGRSQVLRAMIRSIQKKYSSDYEILIRQYFEQLQNSNEKLNNF
ncbi:MAG: hypothetical protein GX121_04285 [Ignavibacteria bacterium]|nr:hypothetical protein [Ignavibacteria bacterium]